VYLSVWVNHIKEQTMQLEPPLIGHTYVSRSDPTMTVYVADVNVFEPDDDASTLFTVECCDPAYKDDIWNADGFEMTSDVWAKYDFALVAE
jgi:hypothetical protein